MFFSCWSNSLVWILACWLLTFVFCPFCCPLCLFVVFPPSFPTSICHPRDFMNFPSIPCHLGLRQKPAPGRWDPALLRSGGVCKPVSWRRIWEANVVQNAGEDVMSTPIRLKVSIQKPKLHLNRYLHYGNKDGKTKSLEGVAIIF